MRRHHDLDISTMASKSVSCDGCKAHDNDCIDVITAIHPKVAAVETPRKQGTPRRAVFRMWMASKALGCFGDGRAFVCVSDMAFIEE